MKYYKKFLAILGAIKAIDIFPGRPKWTNKLCGYRKQINYMPLTKKNIDTLNAFIRYCQKANCFVDLNERHTTNLVYSGTNIKYFGMGCWINHTANNSVCDTIVLDGKKLFVIRLGNKPANEIIRGKTAFSTWQKYDKEKVLQKTALSAEEGKKYADQCYGTTLIDSVVNNYENGGYWLPSCKVHNAFHIDGNSMWPAGAIKRYPELKSIVEAVNSNNEHKKAKLINNLALGFGMSAYDPYGPYAHAQFSFAGRLYCRKSLLELSKTLKKQGYRVLSYQTDGLWAVAKKGVNPVYSGPEIGSEIGQFKIDYYGGDLLLCPQGWLYEGGYHNNDKNNFDKGLRGNYLYSKKKPYNDWNKADCLAALKTSYRYSLKLDPRTYQWKFDKTNFKEHYYEFEDITDREDCTL